MLCPDHLLCETSPDFSLCSPCVYTTPVDVFFSLKCSFLRAGWYFLYPYTPGCWGNDSKVCFMEVLGLPTSSIFWWQISNFKKFIEHLIYSRQCSRHRGQTISEKTDSLSQDIFAIVLQGHQSHHSPRDQCRLGLCPTVP